MVKKGLLAGGIIAMSLCLASCIAPNKDIKQVETFKSSYESINNEAKGDSGTFYREVHIAKNNPVEISNMKSVLDKIDNKDSFLVFFGYAECPWCRSMVESMVKSAKDNKIKKIYYVDIENERDQLEYQPDTDSFAEVSIGSKEYKKMLKKIGNVLDKYEIEYTNADGETKKKDTKEKRIYAPSLVYIQNGKAIKMIDGLSEKQKDENEVLTKEIKADMKQELNDFFASVDKKVNACSASGEKC